MAQTPQQLNVITMYIADLARSKQFYQETFGWNLAFEDSHSAVFEAGSTRINLLIDSQAPELIEPVPVAPRQQGHRILLTIVVEDLAAEMAGLAERGATPINGPIDRPWGVRTACYADPDGFIWELAQPIG